MQCILYVNYCAAISKIGLHFIFIHLAILISVQTLSQHTVCMYYITIADSDTHGNCGLFAL